MWRQEGANVVALEVAPALAGARAGLQPRDVLLTMDGIEVRTVAEVSSRIAASRLAQPVRYVVQRASVDVPVTIELQAAPIIRQGLYFSLALVGILAIVVGASVRLRRPHDLATLHFFWLTVTFFGVLAFSPSGRYDRIDYFFDWADLVARLLLPPLFLHFALVFPERPNAWVRSRAGWPGLVGLYAPAALLGAARVAAVTGAVTGPAASVLLRARRMVGLRLPCGVPLSGGSSW